MRYKWIVIVAVMSLVFASEAAAVTWSAPLNLSAAGQDAWNPQVTISADGTKMTSVWRFWNGSNDIVQVSTSADSGATWSDPVNLSAAGQDASDPQITGSADGSKLTCVWPRIDYGKWIIQASTSADSGATWSDPVNLSAAGHDALYPQITGSADGSKLTSVWERFDGSIWIIQASTSIDSGDTWSTTPVNLSAAGQEAKEPQVTGSADGSKLTSVWYRYDGSNNIIQARTSADSGATWSTPVNLSAAGQNAFNPRITGSADGSKLTSVWYRSDGSNNIIQASTSIDSGATWSTTPVNLSAAGQNADLPQVTGSTDGSKLTSVWMDGSNNIVQASKSIDSGATWSTPVNLSAAGPSTRIPQVTGSADGSKLTSVWSRWDGSNYIVQASMSTDSGATWSAAVNLSAAGQDARYPQATVSADGGKLISVWERNNGSNQIIQAVIAVIAPTATTNAASGITGTGATLNGTVNANNASTAVTFQYGLDTNYGTTVTAVPSPVTGMNNTPVSKAVTGLTPNTTYHYRVVAVNSDGTTHGSDMTFTTSGTGTSGTGMFYVIPNRKGGGAVIYLE